MAILRWSERAANRRWDARRHWSTVAAAKGDSPVTSKSAYMALIMAAMSICSMVWPAKADNFMARDHIVVDLQHNIDLSLIHI